MLKPEKGLVIRYDFLFESQNDQGRSQGKDRPCAVVLTSNLQSEGKHMVIVCPITHTPPSGATDGIEIPSKVRDHLGLDGGRSWIKVNELNRFQWQEDQYPYGLTPVSRGQWAYGFLPRSLYRQMRAGVEGHIQRRSVSVVNRDEDTEPGN